jgi:Family of unknown function (DUF6082)
VKRKLHLGRGGLFALGIFGGLMIISLVIVLPIALLQASRVSQFYLAISASASSLALAGVAISLLYQARAGHTAREQAIRSLQQQLIKMQMDDPTLMTAMGAPWGLPIPAESARIRDHLYIHMWATFWAGNYAVGELNAAAVRGVASVELFSSLAGRTYWANVRERILSTSEGKYLRFARIVDDEYQKVIASNAPVASPVKVTNSANDYTSPRESEVHRNVLMGAALIASSLAGQKLWQRKAK